MRSRAFLAAMLLAAVSAFNVGDEVYVMKGKFRDCLGVVEKIRSITVDVKIDCQISFRAAMFDGSVWEYPPEVLKLKKLSDLDRLEQEEMEMAAMSAAARNNHLITDPISDMKWHGSLHGHHPKIPDPNARAPSNTLDPEDVELPTDDAVNREALTVIEEGAYVIIFVGRYRGCHGIVVSVRGGDKKRGGDDRTTYADNGDGQITAPGLKEIPQQALVLRDCPGMPGHEMVWWYSFEDVYVTSDSPNNKKKPKKKQNVANPEDEEKDLTANGTATNDEVVDSGDPDDDGGPEINFHSCSAVACKVGERVTMAADDAYDDCEGVLSKVDGKTRNQGGDGLGIKVTVTDVHCEPDPDDDYAHVDSPGDMKVSGAQVKRLVKAYPQPRASGNGRQLAIDRSNFGDIRYMQHTDLFKDMVTPGNKTAKKFDPYFQYRDGSKLFVRRGLQFRLNVTGDPKGKLELYLKFDEGFGQDAMMFASPALLEQGRSWCFREKPPSKQIVCNIPSNAPVGIYQFVIAKPMKVGMRVEVKPNANYQTGGTAEVTRVNHAVYRHGKRISGRSYDVVDDGGTGYKRVKSDYVSLKVADKAATLRRHLEIVVLFNPFPYDPKRSGWTWFRPELTRQRNQQQGLLVEDKLKIDVGDQEEDEEQEGKTAAEEEEVIDDSAQEEAAAMGSLLEVEDASDDGAKKKKEHAADKKSFEREQAQKDKQKAEDKALLKKMAPKKKKKRAKDSDILVDRRQAAADAEKNYGTPDELLEDPAELEEYIQNQQGLIFDGFHDDRFGLEWDYGQWNIITLKVALDVLAGLSSFERRSPALVARHLSHAIVAKICLIRMGGGSYTKSWGHPGEGYPCATMDDLRVNWKQFKPMRCNDPSRWKTSVDIFRQHLDLVKADGVSTRVQFCHDKHVAAILTSLSRTLGIPSRTVTGYNIGKDINGDRAISKFWSPPGLDKKGDIVPAGGLKVYRPIIAAPCPVWCYSDFQADVKYGCKDLFYCMKTLLKTNIPSSWEKCKTCAPCVPCISAREHIWWRHVWTELKFKRKDIPGGLADGWQAIDPSPQEYSNGVFQNGPAPVNLIGSGNTSCFDTQTFISNLAGDIKLNMMSMAMKNGFYAHSLHIVDPFMGKERSVGLSIMTKKPGKLSNDSCIGVRNWMDRDCAHLEMDISVSYKPAVGSSAKAMKSAGEGTPAPKCDDLRLHGPTGAKKRVSVERVDEYATTMVENMLTGPDEQIKSMKGRRVQEEWKEMDAEIYRESKADKAGGWTKKLIGSKKLLSDEPDYFKHIDQIIGYIPKGWDKRGDVAFNSPLFRSGKGSHNVLLDSILPLTVHVSNNATSADGDRNTRTIHCLWEAVVQDYDGVPITHHSKRRPDGSLVTVTRRLLHQWKIFKVNPGSTTSFSVDLDLDAFRLDSDFRSYRENDAGFNLVFSGFVEETGQHRVFEKPYRFVEGGEAPTENNNAGHWWPGEREKVAWRNKGMYSLKKKHLIKTHDQVEAEEGEHESA